jgi:hypothetical protein
MVLRKSFLLSSSHCISFGGCTHGRTCAKKSTHICVHDQRSEQTMQLIRLRRVRLWRSWIWCGVWWNVSRASYCSCLSGPAPLHPRRRNHLIQRHERPNTSASSLQKSPHTVIQRRRTIGLTFYPPMYTAESSVPVDLGLRDSGSAIRPPISDSGVTHRRAG